MNPKIKFQLNKELDKEMAGVFLDMKAGGINFSEGLLSTHPELKRAQKMMTGQRKKIIDAYFDEYYDKNWMKLTAAKQDLEKNWRKIKKRYFHQTAQIFYNYPFPEGEYFAYVSSLNCNPRFLKDRSFQVYFAAQHKIYIVSHEMLHFIFYDYAMNMFSGLFGALDTERGPFWEMAEIFNSIILHTSGFKKIHGVKKTVLYPEHKNHFVKLRKIWSKEKDIDKWILSAYCYLTL